MRGETTGGSLASRVLRARGMTDPAVIEAFLAPSLLSLHDPSLIPDLDRGADRILHAIDEGDPIVIYGDYDVDGITATAILYHMLLALRPEADVRTYVPDRMTEGYGLNCDAIEQLASAGARVIISVDCGVTAVEPALAAARAGVDLIITDHHNPPERVEDLPAAFAVIHPRRPDSPYPFGELPGAGVAYKLAWRLATLRCGGERVTAELRTLLVELLTFASMGVIADVVPLRDENRVLARHGLPRIARSRFEGLRALVVASGLADERIDAMSVGFRLGPRLNAAGRMDHARDAVELFTTATGDRAQEIAESLSSRNDERRRVEREIFEQACERAEAAGMTRPGCRAIVLADPAWHPGVVGIVCSRLVERYSRPAILMQLDSSGESPICKGSGRSIDCYDLHGGLVDCASLLIGFGGHDMAAGLRLDAARLDAFVERFTAHANERIPEEALTPELLIDVEAPAEALTVESVTELESLAPFGRGNPSVNVLVRGARLISPMRPLGQTGKHVSMLVRGAERSRGLRVVGWGWDPHRDTVASGDVVDLVLRPRLSHFNGRTTVEPELQDLAVGGGGQADPGANAAGPAQIPRRRSSENAATTSE